MKLRMNSKKVKKWVYYFFKIFFLCAGFGLINLSSEVYFVGFHNVDLGYNYQSIAHETNSRLEKSNATFRIGSVFETLDNTSDNTLWTLHQGYRKGIEQQRVGRVLGILAAATFIIGLLMIKSPH